MTLRRTLLTGTENFLHDSGKQSHEALHTTGIAHVWIESSGAHVGFVWRKYLAGFAPRFCQ